MAPQVGPSVGRAEDLQIKHVVNTGCVPGAVLGLPLGIHRPLGQMDTRHPVIHLSTSGLGVCCGGAWVLSSGEGVGRLQSLDDLEAPQTENCACKVPDACKGTRGRIPEAHL